MKSRIFASKKQITQEEHTMTIITGRQFRANQSKYIRLAHSGERVILSSRAGYAELTPISEEDKQFDDYIHSETFCKIAENAVREFREGKTLKFNNAADAQKWMDEL